MSIELETINIFVIDMKKTLDFYSLLGFHFDDNAYLKEYVKLSFDNFSLCFYSLNIVQEYFTNNSIQTSSNHQFELSFRMFSPTDVDKTFNKMVKNGCKVFKEPENSDWNQRVAFLLDPDNNIIELCADLNM